MPLDCILQAVHNILAQAVRLPLLTSVELHYMNWEGWSKLFDFDFDDDDQEELESQSHFEFINHTLTAVQNWQGSMDWRVLEKRQTHEYNFASSYVRLMR